MKKALKQREPLYLQVEDALRTEIAGLAPGDCLPPERILCERYGVSRITVRTAIRILTDEGRLEGIQGRGTFVREAPFEAERRVALLLSHNISSPRASSFYLRLAQEIRELLDGRKTPSRLYISRRTPGQEQFDFDCPEFFQDMKSGKIRGIIGVLLGKKGVESLQGCELPIVGFGANKHYNVTHDRRRLFASAVEELLRRGRRRLALITWGGFESDRSESAGIFREVLQGAGLPVVEPWTKDDIYPTLEGSGWGAFREIWSSPLGHPDGLVVDDDFFLQGVAAAIGEMGIKVPDQLEIAAYLSDRPLMRYPFPLIAWQPDIPAIARAIVNTEMQLLRGEKPARASQWVPLLRLSSPKKTAENGESISPKQQLHPIP